MSPEANQVLVQLWDALHGVLEICAAGLLLLWAAQWVHWRESWRWYLRAHSEQEIARSARALRKVNARGVKARPVPDTRSSQLLHKQLIGRR